MSNNTTYIISRDTYRKVKKMDHKEMDGYIRRIYASGYEKGRRDALKPVKKDEKTE